MSSSIEFDEKRGEVRLLGIRQMVMNIDALCSHLDKLVGSQVAEVIMKNLELQEGKEEAERFRQNYPDGAVEDFVDLMKQYDALSGVGITSVTFSENQDRSFIEILNPYIKRTTGSSKSLLFSWWCGALSAILHRELDLETITYDASRDILKCTIAPRLIK